MNVWESAANVCTAVGFGVMCLTIAGLFVKWVYKLITGGKE